MNKIIIISIVIFFAICSKSWAEEVDAIPLSIFKQDYTITKVDSFFVYGKIDKIDIEVDEIKETSKVLSFTLKEENFSTEFYVSSSYTNHWDIIQNKIKKLEKGNEIAVSISGRDCNHHYDACYLEDIHFNFIKIARDLPQRKRSTSILSVDQYFDQGIIYGHLPIKIKGIVAKKWDDSFYAVNIVGENL